MKYDVIPELDTLFVTIREERRTQEYGNFVPALFDKVVHDSINEEGKNGYNFVAFQERDEPKDILLVFQMVARIEHLPLKENTPNDSK